MTLDTEHSLQRTMQSRLMSSTAWYTPLRPDLGYPKSVSRS